MSEKEMMVAGQLYSAQDSELSGDYRRAKMLTSLINSSAEQPDEYRRGIVEQLFFHAGRNATVVPTFNCDYGYNITVGDNFYANYDCIIIDVCSVSIGDNVFLGPRVCIYTAAHPIDAAVRGKGLEYGKPVRIGNNVWIGGNCVINPGVKIGDNAVIGSGSVVVKDVPPDVVAAGNPCRIIRPITEIDTAFWKEREAEYYRLKAIK